MAIYEANGIFRQRPNCVMYYVTTGSWKNDETIVARRDSAIQEITDLQIFNAVEFYCFGADEIQSAYSQTRNPISRQFIFSRRLDIPSSPGVDQAWIGYIPFTAFRRIVSDDTGNEILGSIFNDNVRDWQEYAGANNDIRETLVSPARARFVLMNNGITIIARNIKATNERFTIEDFQIVNGC